MAATARRRDPDEDIAAIAKQISDQAEAIYQNWKSRGLAPADLISCHAAGDTSKLGSMLKPQPPAKPPSIELLAQAPTMDNNRLEKLVKNFVVEDKARLAAAANTRIHKNNQPHQQQSMPSSIQYALQKFEKNATSNSTSSAQCEPDFGPSHKKGPSAIGSSSKIVNNGYGSSNNSSSSNTSSPVTSPSGSPAPAMQQTHPVKPHIGQKPQISPKPRFTETIEMTLPEDINPTGLQTWPLKNRLIPSDTVKKATIDGRTQPQQQNHSDRLNHQPQYNTLPNRTSSATTTIDEVALEEKRLINALKNGVVVAEEAPIPSVGTSVLPVVKPKEPSEKETPVKWGQRNTTTPRRPVTADQPQPQQAVVPHPELTSSQRQHIRQTAANPIRPFLTRGSVAERVLIFERCPSDLLLDKRVRPPLAQVTKPQPLSKQQQSPQHTTLQRHVRANRNVNIPRFHYPTGKPGPAGQLETIKSKVAAVFATAVGERAQREHYGAITQACQLPLYWKTPLYLAACADKGSCTLEQFMAFWTSMSSTCHDAASRFVHILTRGKRQWLAPEDFIPLVQDVVETHPGLTFLKEATEFHSRYVHTVIARIYYCVNRSWSGKISIPELRRSNLLGVIQLLEEEEDINQITQYFSYEHFYVIYCKFWELDRDHDLFIDKQDLTRHNDHALSSRIIDRIFSGCVTRGQKRSHHDDKMSYTEFVWFLLSEEDKQHPTAVEYWFRCMDLDGDGYLSMYELEYFYEEQMQRMEAIGIETLPFYDCLCQMLDMVKPKCPGRVSLSDLKKCKMTPIFFDTFFNLEKYLDHEQRDPFASQRDHDIDGQEMSDWDRYAAEEYELLVAEEGGNDQQDSLSFDEGNEDLLSQHLDVALDIDQDQADQDEEDEEDDDYGEDLSTDSDDQCSI